MVQYSTEMLELIIDTDSDSFENREGPGREDNGSYLPSLLSFLCLLVPLVYGVVWISNSEYSFAKP